MRQFRGSTPVRAFVVIAALGFLVLGLASPAATPAAAFAVTPPRRPPAAVRTAAVRRPRAVRPRIAAAPPRHARTIRAAPIGVTKRAGVYHIAISHAPAPPLPIMEIRQAAPAAPNVQITSGTPASPAGGDTCLPCPQPSNPACAACPLQPASQPTVQINLVRIPL